MGIEITMKPSIETPPRAAKAIALGLGCAATATALGVSTVASWQRGGWLAERLLLTAIGSVLILGAHLLPALSRHSGYLARCVGALLWLASMAATVYGHSTFFLMAQLHAGQARAAIVTAPTIAPTTPTGRELSAIASDKAAAASALARSNARRCTDGCAALHATRISLAAKIDALTVEAGEAARRERDDDRRAAQEDRAAAQRDEARADPMTTRLASMIGGEPARVELLAGMAFALTLELVAAFAWAIGLQPQRNNDPEQIGVARKSADSTTERELSAPTGVTESPSEPLPRPMRDVTDSDEVPPVKDLGEAMSEIERVTQHVAAGLLKPSTRAIRAHLGCSTAKALELSRRLKEPPATGVQ